VSEPRGAFQKTHTAPLSNFSRTRLSATKRRRLRSGVRRLLVVIWMQLCGGPAGVCRWPGLMGNGGADGAGPTKRKTADLHNISSRYAVDCVCARVNVWIEIYDVRESCVWARSDVNKWKCVCVCVQPRPAVSGAVRAEVERWKADCLGSATHSSCSSFSSLTNTCPEPGEETHTYSPHYVW